MANGNDNDDKIFVFITTAKVIPGNKIKQSNNQRSNHVGPSKTLENIKLIEENLPKNTILVNKSRFKQYFGPFAGRAFYFQRILKQ